MKTAIQLQHDALASLNRMEVVFNRVVDSGDEKAIEEFTEEKERIQGIIYNLKEKRFK